MLRRSTFRVPCSTVQIVCLIWLVSLFLLPVGPSRGATPESDWGPFYSRMRDLNGDMHHRALGPIFERTDSAWGQHYVGVRPFYSKIRDDVADRTNTEICWPLALTKSFKDQYQVRVLTALYLDTDVNDPASRYRFWLVPFYFQGRDTFGEEYMALFPLGGSVREFIGQDEISFALFPLWMQSSLKGVKSKHLFWPIYARTQGGDIDRFRVFPFYAHNQVLHQYRKTAILWPFWSSAEYWYPNSSGSGFILFPLWGRTALSDEDSWVFLPPFFRYSHSDTLTKMYLPYPFFQRSSGEEEKLYLFPFWGKKTLGGSHHTFFLWPIFFRQRIDKGTMTFHRFLALPFVHSHVYRAPAHIGEDVGKTVSRYLKIWPLFSYQQEGELRRWRALELWPKKHSAPLERNFAPLWTLYTRHQEGDRVQSEWLWGLVRQQREDDRRRYLSVFPLFQYEREEGNRSFSLLKGLLRYDRHGTRRSWRVLFGLRFGDEEIEPSEP